MPYERFKFTETVFNNMKFRVSNSIVVNYMKVSLEHQMCKKNSIGLYIRNEICMKTEPILFQSHFSIQHSVGSIQCKTFSTSKNWLHPLRCIMSCLPLKSKAFRRM